MVFHRAKTLMKNSILMILGGFFGWLKCRRGVFFRRPWCDGGEKLVSCWRDEKLWATKNSGTVWYGAQRWKVLSLPAWEGAPQGH
jgi:hypothetical protein